MKLVLIGGGGHARVAADMAREAGFDLLGVLTREGDPSTLDVPRLGGNEWIDRADADIAFHAAVGATPARRELFERLLSLGRATPVILSPRAPVSATAKVGEGSLVVWNAVINAGATVGRNCIVNTGAVVEHDVTIGDHGHIAPAAVICGGVTIGHSVVVGAGATILPGLRIADHVVIGAGAVVTKSVATNGAVLCGNPARILP